MKANRLILTLVLTLAFGAGLSAVFASAGDELLTALKSVEPGSEPIGVKIWVDRDDSGPPRKGDRIIIQCMPERDGYLAVVGVSSHRDMKLLFPNNENKSAALKAGKLYTLFGDDSELRLRLGSKTPESHFIFLVTTGPIQIGEVLNQAGGSVSVPSAQVSTDRAQELVTTLKNDKGLNVIRLPVPGGPHSSFELYLKKKKRGKIRMKALPPDTESEQPEVVTGTQGVTPDTKKMRETE